MKVRELLEKSEDDLDDVVKDQEFSRSNSRITSDGKRIDVEVLTKQQYFDSHDVTVEFTYIINPLTKAWSFRAGMPGGEDVEFATGEDESTLIKHLKRKNKIKPSAIDDYLMEEKLHQSWRQQTEKELKQEFDYEYALPKRRWDARAATIGAKYPMFDSLEDFIEKVRSAKVVTIKESDYRDVHNLTSLPSIKDIKQMTDTYSYPRDVDSIVRGFEKGEELPYPIIIKGKKGRWILSGNTRLNVAKVLGKQAKALEVDCS